MQMQQQGGALCAWAAAPLTSRAWTLITLQEANMRLVAFLGLALLLAGAVAAQDHAALLAQAQVGCPTSDGAPS